MPTESTGQTNEAHEVTLCYQCREECEQDYLFDNPYDGNLRCEYCNERFERENQDELYEEGEYYDIPYREYDTKKYICSEKSNLKTEILQSKRAFGIELECQGDSRRAIMDISDDMDNRIGISTDGSICGDNGFELQFPLINGVAGEKIVNDTCSILNTYRTKVDDSCGFHVHLQSLGNERNFHFLQRLMFVHLIFEDVIMSFLPRSRQNNRYCQKLKNYINIDHVLLAKEKSMLEQLWYKSYNKNDIRRRKAHKYDEARYFGFNYHCYFSKGKHIEIRHHNGTTNAKKILHWVNLHSLIIDWVREQVRIEKNIHNWDFKDNLLMFNDSTFMGTIQEKTDFLFSLIGLSQQSQEYFINRRNKINTCAE